MDNHRAVSDQDKNMIMERLADLWKQHPQLRLGQLLANAPAGDPGWLRVAEDFILIRELEEFYAHYPPHPVHDAGI